jgi:hypothetical protein
MPSEIYLIHTHTGILYNDDGTVLRSSKRLGIGILLPRDASS